MQDYALLHVIFCYFILFKTMFRNELIKQTLQKKLKQNIFSMSLIKKIDLQFFK